jgi:hypothetical protein
MDSYRIDFTFDPDSPLSWEEQMKQQFPALLAKKMAHEKIERGRDQVRKGELRSEIATVFMSSFPPDAAEKLEADIKRLRSIEKDKKFRAEVIRLFMEVYLAGVVSGYKHHEAIGNMLEKRSTPSGGAPE